MAFNDTEKTDAKIEQAYLDLLAKTLSAAKEKWSEPWLRSIVNFNPQGFDGARYSGMNNFFLALSDMVNGYSTPIHVTFACAQNEGFRVKRGEKGEPILKFCPYYLPDDEGKKKGMKYASEDDYLKMDDETKAYYHKVAKTVGYTVFNLDQTTIQAENPKLYKKMLDRFSKLTGERDNVQKTAIAGLDETIRNNTWICPIKTDSIGKAYWNSKANIIKVPDKADFRSDVSFYRTLVHEMIHSTTLLPKHPLTPEEQELLASENCPDAKREALLKKQGEQMRTYDYGNLPERAREEMVAELGSAMVLTQIGIDATFAPENKAYLQNWGEYLGIKVETGMVENPEFRAFGLMLQSMGWRGNLQELIKDVAEVEKGKSLKAVYKYHHIPDNALAHNFLEMVRDGVKPLKVMGEKYVSMTEAERMQSGISKTILSDIVKDAWQAAKVVMAEGIKIDLKKELGQAENFSKINDKRRTEPEKKGKSKSGGYKKSNTAVARKTTKKYGR